MSLWGASPLFGESVRHKIRTQLLSGLGESKCWTSSKSLCELRVKIHRNSLLPWRDFFFFSVKRLIFWWQMMASVLLFRQLEPALDAALTVRVDGDVEGYRLQGPLLTFPLPDSLGDASVLAPASSAQNKAANGAFLKVPHQSRTKPSPSTQGWPPWAGSPDTLQVGLMMVS